MLAMAALMAYLAVEALEKETVIEKTRLEKLMKDHTSSGLGY
jgi:hypothetical protein